MFFIAVLYLTPEGTGQQPPYHSTSACRRSPTSNWRSQDSYGSPGFLAKVLLAHRVNPFVRTSHYKALALLREDLGSAYAVCTIFWGEVWRPGFIPKVASSLKEAKDRYDARLSESKANLRRESCRVAGPFLHWIQQTLKTSHAFSSRIVSMLPDYRECADPTVGIDCEVYRDHPTKRSKSIVTSNCRRTNKVCNYETWVSANRMAARLGRLMD